jgi:hypothetical protein
MESLALKVKKDIKRGAVFEDFLESLFKARGWVVKRAMGYVPAYDLIITKDRSTLKIEAKFDEMSDSTGNYAFEKKSLDQSQSDLFIIGTLKEAYVLTLDQAKWFYETATDIRQTGDQQTNYSALVPKFEVAIKAQRFL